MNLTIFQLIFVLNNFFLSTQHLHTLVTKNVVKLRKEREAWQEAMDKAEKYQREVRNLKKSVKAKDNEFVASATNLNKAKDEAHDATEDIRA